ncbi:unnamed protein product [Dibothriocephalus latus]|uniref:Uncharacterized protein n=1 Tax=Dibothriocephalus latus TaxID=60516 RepID=A0A3P7LH82_DIBLA|nr:unnamed protein product [Dibothriocephalus latus]
MPHVESDGEIEGYGSADGAEKKDSLDRDDLAEPESRKSRNQVHPWLRRLLFEPELRAIEKVSKELEKEKEVAYNTETENESYEKGEEEVRDMNVSCVDHLKKRIKTL